MEFYASGKKTFYQPQSSYQPNIDAGLLAHVREEVFKREEEQKKQQEKKKQDEKRTKMASQIQSMVTNLPMYVKENYCRNETNEDQILSVVYLRVP